MFRNNLAFFKGLEQNSSTSQTSTPLTKPSTSSTLTTGRFFTNSSGIRVPIQTSSNLETRPKTTTSTPSTSTASLGAKPKTSSSISTQPTSSSTEKQESLKISSPYIENLPRDLIKRALADVLSTRVNKRSIDPGDGPRDNVVLNNLRSEIYDLSIDIFNNKVKSHFMSKNMTLSPDEKTINESAKNFANSIVNLAVNDFNSGIKYFYFLADTTDSTLIDQRLSLLRIPTMYGNNFEDSFDKALKNSIHIFTSSLK